MEFLKKLILGFFRYVKLLFIWNFSFCAFVNFCIYNKDAEAKNFLFKYHPDFIGKNENQAVESFLLIRKASKKKEKFDLNSFEFHFSQDYYFLFKGFCGPFLRIFNYKQNYKHKMISMSYNTCILKFQLVIIWCISIAVIFLFLFSSLNSSSSKANFYDWPILHLNSNLASFFSNENDKAAATYFQNNLMGNLQCFLDILLTSIFIACNFTLNNEILNKPGYFSIYLNFILISLDTYKLISLILKSDFNYNEEKCLNFLLVNWDNFDKVISSLLRNASLIDKSIFLAANKTKKILLRKAYNSLVFIFILVFFAFAVSLGLQMFYFFKCQLFPNLFFSYFSNIFIKDVCITFAFVGLVPLTILPFQYALNYSFVFLFYLLAQAKKFFKCKNNISSLENLNEIVTDTDIETILDGNLNPLLESDSEELESQKLEVRKLELDKEKNNLEFENNIELENNEIKENNENNEINEIITFLPDEKNKENLDVMIQLENEEFGKKAKLEEVQPQNESKNEKKIFESKADDLEKQNEKNERHNEQNTQYIIETFNLKPVSLFTICVYPITLFSLFAKIQYVYPLILSAGFNQDSAANVAYGLPYLSLSYYSIAIERLESKIEKYLAQARIILKFIDSLLF